MERQTLNGNWNIESTDGKYNLESPVPGSLFYALEKEGQFGKQGIFYREKNRQALDIANRDFIWSRKFTVSEQLLTDKKVNIVALGLDTLGEISINAQKIANTDNMHRTWRFDVSSVLHPGENEISILFRNTLEYIKKEKERRDIYAADGHGLTSVPGFNMIRKSHCSYGWDWGPMVPDVGIWRDIYLESYSTAKLKSVHVTQVHTNDSVTLQFHPDLEILKDSDYVIQARIISPEGKEFSLDFAALSNGEFTIENPQLWWPNGLGDQHLYELHFTLLDKKTVLDSLTMNVGLRTLTIEQKEDQWGETFNFSCNGVSLFARGGNYIPEDVYLNRNEPYSTAKLIEDCKKANFNCIRVWGGGVYPSDEFYDLCDSHGLIVWQDMMFACAAYDINNDHFLQNIIEELRDNLTRIRHHASIGLICGNNEMEMAFEDWGFNPTNEMRTEYLKQYQFIFPQLIQEICPEHFYWPASPSSGGDFENPNDPDKGDCHFWEVWHGNKDFSEFKKHYFRFMSEFGFESFPSMKTIKTFSEEEDLNIFSPVMEEHQKCPGANGKILTYLSKYYRYPRDLDSLVYVSQISQMEAITTGIDHWRRNRGRCMGSTYWQLNDNWPVASWSSIDYFGRWKALHYGAKRAYDNVLLSIDGDEKSASIHVSNEGLEEVKGTVQWSLFNLDGHLLDSGEMSIAVPELTSKLIESRDFSAETNKKKNRQIYLSCRFVSTNGTVYRAFHNFAPYKYMDLQEPQITTEWLDKKDTYVLTLQADKPAFHVELDFTSIDLVLKDNYFHLDKGETFKVHLNKEHMSLEELKKQLKVRSLFDTY